MPTEPQTTSESPPSARDPDQDLLEGIRRGDGAAFESLVRRHEQRVHRLAWRILGDAEEVAAHAHWRGQVDALQVDLYDHEAAAPVLDSEDFYRHCRTLLTEDGAMTVNLFGRSSSYERSLDRIRAAFGEDAVWAFRPTREGNTVVLALREPVQPTRAELQARADVIESRWGLPARKWLRVFRQV